MTDPIQLQHLLSEADNRRRQTISFALLCLGVVESLAGGAVSADDAVRLFFHASNCAFTHEHLADTGAERIMSHGVQLPDLFVALPPSEAQREFQHELAVMRAECLKLLEDQPVAA